MRRYLVLFAFLMLAVPMHAGAAPILDQQCCPTTSSGYFFNGDIRVQTFTAGLTGLLTGIDVGLDFVSGSLPPFELYDGAFAAGQNVTTFGAPRATLSLVNTGVSTPPAMPGTYFFADLSASGILVTAGQQFSIVMRPPPPPSLGTWIVGPGNSYAGGEFLVIFNLTGQPSPLLLQPAEAVFRTYVDPGVTPPPVPEPGTLLLIASGAAGLLARRRSRAARA